MDKQSVVKLVLAGAFALAAGSMTAHADNHGKKKMKKGMEKGHAMEKCYGISKAKQNECSAPGHACAGHAEKDSVGAEWIMLPKGKCEKIVNGSLTPKS